MPFGCPICNAFTTLQEKCCNCGNAMSDKGRYSDYFGDYSPYRPIDELKLSDGILDNEKNHACAHVTFCENCNHSQLTLIQEIALPE